MSFKPRPYQEEALNNILYAFNDNKKVLFQGSTGMGKCHSKDTPIMMHDQTIKMVQDVVVGDLLMGDDSTPRKVLSLARGQENLYNIHQEQGMTYGVNESHILSLKHCETKEVHNINVLDYMKRIDGNKLKGYNAIHTSLTDISIQKIGYGDYYGFEIDGNHLYCLGDFTVTHNTFIFTMITKHYSHQLNKKVLILCHRSELVEQTINSLARIGVTSEKVVSTTRKLHHNSDAYVAMIETANNRLLKNPDFFKDVGLIICDECHILIFNKVFDFFPQAKILGCTATPVLMQRVTYWKCDICRAEHNEHGECHGYEMMEWSKPLTMSNFYDTIVVGPSIKFLIDEGYLVPEVSFIEKYVNEDDLKIDSRTGDFTTASQDEAYNKKEVVFNIVENYKKLCLGKKTMIFTSSTKSNITLLEEFKEQGIENVRAYDSVNNKASERKELMEWFKSARDAVLVNTGVFTTGTDVTDVEAIIMARSTLSLSLFLQIVGRGGRITDVIFKDSFIFIDGGGNIDRHLEWSDDSRDWFKIFYNGIGEDRPKKMQLDAPITCERCTAIYARAMKICPECGYEEEIPDKIVREKDTIDSILEPIRKIPPPSGEMIYKYTKSQGENINFAFKILVNKIVELFIMWRIGTDWFTSETGPQKVHDAIERNIRNCYHFLSRQRDIIPENWQGRKITTLIEMVKEKLKKYYNLD